MNRYINYAKIINVVLLGVLKGREMNNKGKLIAGVTAVLIGSVSPVFLCSEDSVFCEKVYDIQLSAETVNIDINDIPENREVQVGINIDNNPGFLGLCHYIELDNRLKSDHYFSVDFDHNRFGMNVWYNSDDTMMEIKVIHSDTENTFNDNGRIYSLKLILPEDVKPGDFYPVNIKDYYDDGSYQGESFILRENDFDSYYYRENFAQPVNGGIRITGELPKEPEPTKAPEPTQSPSKQDEKPSAAPSQLTQDNPDNKNSGEKTDGNKAETTTSAVSESVTVAETTVVSTEGTTVSSAAVESTFSTVSDTTCGETVLEETVSETTAAPSDNKKEGSKSLAAGFAGITGALIGVLIYRSNKKRGEKTK